jgi:hypothetical protein
MDFCERSECIKYICEQSDVGVCSNKKYNLIHNSNTDIETYLTVKTKNEL